MTFISDADVRDEVLVGSLPPETPLISGYMLLPDGTRYRIDNGLVTWIRDRNRFQLSARTTPDTFNRTDRLSLDRCLRTCPRY